MKKKEQPQRPSQPQVKYLRELLASANRAHRDAIYAEEFVETAEVRAARAVIKKWQSTREQKFHKQRNNRLKVLSAAASVCERLALFSEPQDALDAVDAFAARKF